MPRFEHVVLGGTFDRLHLGHEALLATAFRSGRSVAIGVTTDAFLARHPKPGGARIRSYASRRRALDRWLTSRYSKSRWTLVPLDDLFGRSVEDGVDALVVSAETLAGGRAVNAERRRRGRRSVPLLSVPLVVADDLRPISSRRIRYREIDRWGRRRSPIRVALAVEDPDDGALAVAGVRAAFPRALVVRVPFPSGSSSAARRRTAELTAARRGELGIVVTRMTDGTRNVVVRGGAIRLVAPAVPRTPAVAFSRALRRLLSPSSAAKRFSLHRR